MKLHGLAFVSVVFHFAVIVFVTAADAWSYREVGPNADNVDGITENEPLLVAERAETWNQS